MYEIKDLPLNKKVIDVYPELAEMFYDLKKQLGSFETLTSDQVIRYIILTYHFQSPLVQSKADLMWRKKQAMLLSGVKVDDKGFLPEEAMNIIMNRNASAIDLKMRFIRFENNVDWVELTMLTEIYYDYIRVMTDESQSVGNKTASDILKVKLANAKESEALKQKIDNVASRVFKGDIDLANFVGSTIVKEERRLRTSPEVKAQIESKKEKQ